MSRIAAFLTLAFILSFPAQAREQVSTDVAASAEAVANSAPTQNCTMHEDANVGISFNSMTADIAEIKNIVDKRIKEVEALATEAGLTKIDLQSQNYSVYTNGGEGCWGESCTRQYQYSGSANFTVAPCDKAVDFMGLLTNKGYNANLNVNMYKQCQ